MEKTSPENLNNYVKEGLAGKNGSAGFCLHFGQ